MALDYLDFEYSEDEDGNGTLDAMASVAHQRLPALLDEVRQVLQWASRQFRGRQAPLDEGGDWDFDLSAQDDDNGRALRLRWIGSTAELEAEAPQAGGYTTVTLTLSGTATFVQAFQTQFDLD